MRLIDIEAEVCADCVCRDKCDRQTDCFVKEMQTVDAVPVIRCRECKHRYTEDCPMYFHASYWHEGYEEYVDDDTDHTEDDYFCQEGERKEV